MYSAQAAARITGISYATILRHIRDGELFADQEVPGGRYQISGSELADYAAYEWTKEKCMMYPPETIMEHIMREDSKGGSS